MYFFIISDKLISVPRYILFSIFIFRRRYEFMMLTSWKIMSQMNMTWTKGAVPPRFGYFVEGQSNSRGRRRRSPVGTPSESLSGDIIFMYFIMLCENIFR